MSDNTERAALIALLAALYMQGDIDAFAAHLATLVGAASLDSLLADMQQARIDSFLAVYEQDSTQLFQELMTQELRVYTNKSADAELPFGQASLDADAERDVKSVAETWQNIIQSHVSKWDAQQSLSAQTAQLHTTLREQAESRAQMVANVTVQKSTDSAQRQFVQDTLTRSRIFVVNDQGDIETRDMLYIAGDNADTLFDRLANMYLSVLPEASSGDFCADYAGKTFAPDEIDFIPFFPAHPGCVHQIELLYN